MRSLPLLGAAFVCGILVDFATVKYYRSIFHRYQLQAFCWSIAITLLLFIIIDRFVQTSNYIILFGYAIGNGIGTVLSMRK
jgi:hypothetical protein